MGDDKRLKHFRQVLLWPVQLLPLERTATIDAHWERLIDPASGGVWSEVDDEFGDPAEFQARHYNEFVTFLPQAQRFLYGQGIGKRVGKWYGESPMRVMRRSDIVQARVALNEGEEPILLDIKHIDLYFFFDIDIVILALEIFRDDIALSTAQHLMFRFGRAYPAYWEKDGRGGHCPWKVEWISQSGDIIAVSDYERREKYLSFVCQHRAPATAAHWDQMLAPLVLHHSDKAGDVRYRQLEYYRMPYMAFLALEESTTLSRSDNIRLALGNEPADETDLPYSESYLADFERRYCYDRYFLKAGGEDVSGTRFLAGGNTLVVIGQANDRFFMDADHGVLARFRHQHFLMFLIAHFQKAAIRMFSDRLVGAVSRLDITDSKANRAFRRETREAHENFLRFSHRYWLQEISNQAQTRELFEMTRSQLKLESIYREVRDELYDMDRLLEEEAARRQNDTVVRLTVVTTFGLIGTVTTGFLGMNLFGFTEQQPAWKLAIFLTVFVPTMLLTLYTVMKSKRLSDFLDALADERRTWNSRIRALLRVWSGRSGNGPSA